MNTHPITRIGALTTAVVLGAGLGLASPLAASAAAPKAGSAAKGEFLSGSILGTDLAAVAEVEAAKASNNGNQKAQVDVDPLSITLLGAANLRAKRINLTPEELVDIGEKTTGGILSQYAKANADGSAIAASGAIGGGGAIGPNASNPGGSLKLDIDSLLNSRLDALVKDLRLEIEAIAAQAKGSAASTSGSYYMEGLKLKFTSPVLGEIEGILDDSIDPIEVKLDALAGSDGILADDTVGLLKSLNPALDLTGSKADVRVRIKADLNGIVNDLLDHSYGNSGVKINLSNGQVTVDLAKVIGGNLNGKPAGYDVLNDGAVASIVDALTDTVADLADDVVERVDVALRNASVDIDADLELLKKQDPITKKVCEEVEVPAEGGLIGDLLGGVGGIVTELVCKTVKIPQASLETSVHVDVHGTVRQILNGNSPANVKAKVLGIPVSISTGRLLNVLDNSLVDTLFDSNGVVKNLTKVLDNRLIDTVNGDLLGGSSLTSVLADVVSINLNVKESSSSTFTQTALRVAVLPSAASGGLTTVNLASASVSPNLAVTDGPIDPDDPDNPGDGPDDSDNPGDDDGPGTDDQPGDDGYIDVADDGGVLDISANGDGNLAFTGMDIVGLIALIAALLATGTALVARERYRRTHSVEISTES